jgi:voltage-gated potassium channel
MHLIEKLSVSDTVYYLITTATTIGYGDISPVTNLGKMLVIPYMFVSITTLGIVLSLTGEKVYHISLKIKKGLISVKNSKLLIIGYPSETKVKDIITQLYADETFKENKITIIDNMLEEKPEWMSEYNIYFIKGLGSDKSVLNRADIQNVETALILASNPTDILSDDSTSSTIAVIEALNSNVRTIAERVRKDTLLFESVGCDVVTRVTSAEILAQEIIDEGAIEIEKAIFSNTTVGTQYNLSLTKKDIENLFKKNNIKWSEIAILFIMKDAVAEGYKCKGEKYFNLSPKANDIIKDDFIIKYRSVSRIVL